MKPPRDVIGQDIIFLVSGGIGDQIAFKPVVKYVKEMYLKGDTLSIVSDYPWILKRIWIIFFQKTKPRKQFQEKFTTP